METPEKWLLDRLEGFSVFLSDSKKNELKDILDKYQKKKSKKRKRKPKEKVFGTEVVECCQKCMVYFPEHLRPDEKQVVNWLDTVDKLNRIDKIPFQVIQIVTKWARNDNFWKSNFMSLPKLRKNNPDGIKYIVVFNEKMKLNGNRNNNQPRTDAELKRASSSAVDDLLG